ncbi:hypothetical protein ACFQU3_08965 [Terrabacter sp. GCM10028922]|uniref:hypothetical protein n=1 Tax=Terrabacter sp. GCM10028922 TaxID=3273428 RepID=UPI00360CA582
MPRARARRAPAHLLAVLTLGMLTILAAALTVVGSDALWLPALGDEIRRAGAVPAGIPFATALSTDWVNTTALGQLVFSLVYEAGSLGVVIAQVVVVALALSTLAWDATSRGSRPVATSAVLVAVAIGAAAPLLIARAQLLSLLPYAVLLVLLRRQHDHPSTAIWWAVPLVALWGNLHGAVLAGVAVLGCYLAFSRLRQSPLTAVGVGIAALAATCLNPGLLAAPRYYLGVFSGEATSDDSGMWSRLSLSNPFDVLLLLAAVVLVAMTFRRRRPVWEYAALLGLAVASGLAARHGIWLLLFLAVPAATTWTRPGHEAATTRLSKAVPSVVSIACLAVAAVVLGVRAPTFRAADAEAARIADATKGRVVLVAEPLAESLAAAGATVWVSNPLDAFSRVDQAAYLAFMNGDVEGARAAFENADVVVAVPGSVQARAAAAAGLARATSFGTYRLFSR